MGVKINFRIITKNRASDPKNRVSDKIDFKAVWPRSDHADNGGVK